MSLLSALLQYSSQFPGRAFTWTSESTPPQHLFYCFHYQPATNPDPAQFKGTSSATQPGQKSRYVTIIYVLQHLTAPVFSLPVDRILKQLGMWKCENNRICWNMNVDVLYEINIIHAWTLSIWLVWCKFKCQHDSMVIWRNRPKIYLGFECSSPSCLELLETTKEGSMPAEQNIHFQTPRYLQEWGWNTRHP